MCPRGGRKIAEISTKPNDALGRRADCRAVALAEPERDASRQVPLEGRDQQETDGFDRWRICRVPVGLGSARL